MTANRRPRRSSGRITLNDVAGAAGVSPITVSRALRGERTVLLRKDVLGRTSGSTVRKSRASDTVADGDRDLFEALRAWRAEQAREQGVPAYVVFGDATLRALADVRPTSLDALDTITGIGAKKKESYGEGVLTVIAAAE